MEGIYSYECKSKGGKCFMDVVRRTIYVNHKLHAFFMAGPLEVDSGTNIYMAQSYSSQPQVKFSKTTNILCAYKQIPPTTSQS